MPIILLVATLRGYDAMVGYASITLLPLEHLHGRVIKLQMVAVTVQSNLHPFLNIKIAYCFG